MFEASTKALLVLHSLTLVLPNMNEMCLTPLLKMENANSDLDAGEMGSRGSPRYFSLDVLNIPPSRGIEAEERFSDESSGY